MIAHQRQPFVATLTRAINKTSLNPWVCTKFSTAPPLTTSISFEVAVTGLEWVANYENTRWFLVLKLEKAPQDGLNKLLHVSNQTAKEFGQPPLYTDWLQPSVDTDRPSRKRHLGNPGRSKETTRAAASGHITRPAPSSYADMSSSFHVSIGWTLDAPSQTLRERLNTTGIDFQAIKIDVNTVKAKIGNGITAIPLAVKIDNSNRIIET